MTLRLRNDHASQIIAHAMEEHPREAVGLIVCHVTTGECRVIKLRNVHPDPENGFEVREREIRDLYRKLNRRFEYIDVIWHSHTKYPPRPSREDIESAELEDAHYLIVATSGDGPAMRSWKIVGDIAFEEPVVFIREDT